MTDLERIKRLELTFLLYVAVTTGEAERGPIPNVGIREELGKMLQAISDDQK